MAITKQKKESMVATLSQLVEGAETLVFVNFHGLTVAAATALRKQLREVGVGYQVAKKSLLRRVLAGSKFEGEVPDLPGEIAVAYGADPLLPAKTVHDFQKKNPEGVAIVGGVFEKSYRDAAVMIALASIPGRDGLYGQLVGLLASPLRGLAVVIQEVAKQKELSN